MRNMNDFGGWQKHEIDEYASKWNDGDDGWREDGWITQGGWGSIWRKKEEG